MASEQMAYLTIDAGGTYLKSAVLNRDGEVLEGSNFITRSFSKGTEEEILNALRLTVSQGIESVFLSRMSLGGIGIAFPGPFDYKNGTPLMEHKFQSIYRINLREIICSIPGIGKDIPIRFMHDANAVLSGEMWKGNAQGFANAAVVTLGTGLGFAFSKNNIVQCNSLGGPLVTIYKLPYKDGILEDFVSQRGFMKIYNEIGGKNIEGIDVSDLGKWANEGDENCIQTFCNIGSILAEALHNIISEKGIQCLLLGGQISRSFHLLEGALKQGLMNVECLNKISEVKNIDNAPLLGAFKAIVNKKIFK